MRSDFFSASLPSRRRFQHQSWRVLHRAIIRMRPMNWPRTRLVRPAASLPAGSRHCQDAQCRFHHAPHRGPSLLLGRHLLRWRGCTLAQLDCTYHHRDSRSMLRPLPQAAMGRSPTAMLICRAYDKPSRNMRWSGRRNGR